MYIIIAGCGKVGSNLAKALSSENHDVVIIDSEAENFNQLGTGFNGVMLSGVPIDQDVLIAAGIDKADALAAVTPDDNMNVMISQIAKKIFNVPRVITRVYDPERDLVFQQLGLTTMCPTTLAVAQVKNTLKQTEQGIWHSFGSKNVNFTYERAGKEHIGKSAKTIRECSMVFGILKDGEFNFAQGDVRIENGDVLVIANYV